VGLIPERTAEHVIEIFVAEIKKKLEANKDKPEVVSVLKKLGRFLLAQFEWNTEWTIEYQILFDMPAPKDYPLLDMSVEDFFTKRRFIDLGIPSNVADRAYRGAWGIARVYGTLASMREFLSECSDRATLERRRPGNCGEKSLDAIVLAIVSAGLPFKS
jgi:hypothetical protein